MGLSLLYISIAYYMQKGGGWVQLACKIAYILNGRAHTSIQNMTIQCTLDIVVTLGQAHASAIAQWPLYLFPYTFQEGGQG